ncbi:TPA: flagellar biosynthetic protein FliQ [bacterium]|nr:flagellar biosynthetic protein FliQ [bacterium]
MTEGFVIQLIQESLLRAVLIASPMLGIGLVVGLVISIVQTATSIQEQTLTFVPKIIAVLFSIGIFGPWMLRMMMDFMTKLIMTMPDLI